MRISDWSSDVCSSDLLQPGRRGEGHLGFAGLMMVDLSLFLIHHPSENWDFVRICCAFRSEEHTSELQSLMRISYAVFCLKKKKINMKTKTKTHIDITTYRSLLNNTSINVSTTLKTVT